MGRRVRKKAYNANGPLVENVESSYDGWRVVKEQDSVSQYLRLYVYGPGIDELVCMKRIFEDTSEDFYYQYDPLGSVVALSGNQSMVLERYSYDAYGKPTIYDADGNTISQSAYGNRFMFTGREYDPATGNYYYRNRDYKPSIGCFLQTDPIPALNLYTYCLNNPLNWIDPWGLHGRLGIHSTRTHSWISYTPHDSHTSTYGLWHNSYAKDSERVHPGTDVRKNKELNKNTNSPESPHSANRYYNIDNGQEGKLSNILNSNQSYTYPTNNCSSFASDTANEVTGEDVDADGAFGLETPSELQESINELEENDPTDDLSPDNQKDDPQKDDPQKKGATL